ncbi:MAG: hypothetical protein IKA46_03235 [Clostridia bacterium]|nr:hypothetical protein [Clostridia bacterium]
MKYTIRILSFFLALCLLVVPLGGCAYHKRPLAYLKSSAERTFKQSLLGEVASLLLDAFEEGSLDLSLSSDSDLGGAKVLDLALYFDADGEQIMADTALLVGEKSYDAKLWFSSREAVLSSTAFLGSTTLGANFETLKQDIAHSIFRNNSGTAYAVPEINESSATAVLTWVEGFYALFGAFEDMPELLDEYIDVFLKYLTQYASYTRYTENGRVKIYLSVDNSMLSRALRDTWAKAAKDKTLARRVREVAKTRDAMQSAIDGVVSTEWSNKVEAWLLNNAEIEALCARIDAAEPFTVEMNATVKRLTGKLLYVDFTYTAGDDVTAFSLDLSEKDAFDVSLLLDGVKRSLTVHVVDSAWRTVAADYTYKVEQGENSPHVWQGTFHLNEKTDIFTLTIGKNGVTKTVSGTFYCDSDACSLMIDKVKTGETENNFRLALTIKAEASAPKVPQYVNLPTVTEQRIDPVAKRAREAYTAFLEEFDRSAITYEAVMAYLLAPFAFEE